MYYRRNADDSVRAALRDWQSRSISAEKLIAVLRRADVPVEITEVNQQKVALHLQIDLCIGTEDSVFGPWGLDEQLLNAAEILWSRIPSETINNRVEGEFDFYTVPKADLLELVPEVEQILQEHIPAGYDNDARDNYSFLINNPGFPSLTIVYNLTPELTRLLSRIANTHHTKLQTSIILKFFGNAPAEIWFKGIAYSPQRFLSDHPVLAVLENHRDFSGTVTTDLDLITALPSYPNFRVIGQTVDQLRGYCLNAFLNSGDAVTMLTQWTLGIWNRQPSDFQRDRFANSCPMSRGLGRACLGIGYIPDSDTSKLLLGHADTNHPVDHPLDSLHFFIFIDNSADEGATLNEGIMECYRIKDGKVRDTISSIDFPDEREGQTEEASLHWLQAGADALAKNFDLRMKIIWLD